MHTQLILTTLPVLVFPKWNKIPLEKDNHSKPTKMARM